MTDCTENRGERLERVSEILTKMLRFNYWGSREEYKNEIRSHMVPLSVEDAEQLYHSFKSRSKSCRMDSTENKLSMMAVCLKDIYLKKKTAREASDDERKREEEKYGKVYHWMKGLLYDPFWGSQEDFKKEVQDLCSVLSYKQLLFVLLQVKSVWEKPSEQGEGSKFYVLTESLEDLIESKRSGSVENILEKIKKLVGGRSSSSVPAGMEELLSGLDRDTIELVWERVDDNNPLNSTIKLERNAIIKSILFDRLNNAPTRFNPRVVLRYLSGLASYGLEIEIKEKVSEMLNNFDDSQIIKLWEYANEEKEALFIYKRPRPEGEYGNKMSLIKKELQEAFRKTISSDDIILNINNLSNPIYSSFDKIEYFVQNLAEKMTKDEAEGIKRLLKDTLSRSCKNKVRQARQAEILRCLNSLPQKAFKQEETVPSGMDPKMSLAFNITFPAKMKEKKKDIEEIFQDIQLTFPYGPLKIYFEESE